MLNQSEFDRMRDRLNIMSSIDKPTGVQVRSIFDEADTWISTWATENLYVLVQASYFAQEGRAYIDVHAGGAYGMRPDPILFETLSTASWRFDHGGPWARILPNGAAFGWRLRLPSELYAIPNEDNAFGFTTALITLFGQTCETLAEELIPKCGGKRILAFDPEAWPALIQGSLPPPGE